ncbi:MAG: hypothetical protein QOF55_1788 [Thermoleophilaceae bacterium]|nr:hypothetical protein [Thermoleophilaceae bacterium]
MTANRDGIANDSAPGEGDQIDPDVESLEGTIHDDTLTGSSGENLLKGRLGSDTLAGGAGGDQLLSNDGVADHCYAAGTGDSVDADLADPTPLAYKRGSPLPLTFTSTPSRWMRRSPTS